MQIIPVVDLMQGQVVHAVAGNRDQYSPVRSRICESAAPAEVGRAFRSLDLPTFYVADLDAIRGQAADSESLRKLAEFSRRILWDPGLRSVGQVQHLKDSALSVQADLVVALETVASAEELGSLVEALQRRVTFSLDMKNGKPLAAFDSWRNREPLSIAGAAVDRGVPRLIVLDLADVGTGRGVSTLPLVEEIKALYPTVEVIAGGGVRGIADLRQMREAGCDGALVASALHNATIGSAEINEMGD